VKPTVATDLLPIPVAICQFTTFAETAGPPIAMKWMT
jgi:hypothetical protein